MKNQLENQLDFSFRQQKVAVINHLRQFDDLKIICTCRKKKNKKFKKKNKFNKNIGYREISA